MVTGVKMLIFNNAGELLFILRDKKAGILNPGRWCIPGGAIEQGETPEQAVEREMMEEIGIVPPSRMVKAVVADNLMYVFLAIETVEQEQITLGEGKQFAFWQVSKLPPLTLASRRTLEGIVI